MIEYEDYDYYDYHNNNHWYVNTYEIVIAAIMSLIGFVGLISNVTVTVVLCKIKQKNLTDVLVINLMVIDLLMCLQIVLQIIATFTGGWVYLLCNFSGIIHQLSNYVAGVTLCAVAIDRYLAKSRSLPRPSTSMLVGRMSIVWFILLLVSVPCFFLYSAFYNYCYLSSMFIVFINHCLMFIATYIIPLITIVTIHKKLSNINQEKHRSFVTNLYRVYVAYVVFWILSFLQVFLHPFGIYFDGIFSYIVTFFSYLPVAVNPFLYMWFSVDDCTEFNQLRKYGTLARDGDDNSLLQDTSGTEGGYGTAKNQ